MTIDRRQMLSLGSLLLGSSLFVSPATAPPSTHFTSVSISLCFSPRSLAKRPCFGSANHGGISRDSTFNLMAFAHGRAWS